MNDQNNNYQKDRKYDLEERTARFAEKIIDLVKKVKITPVNTRIVEQVVQKKKYESFGKNLKSYC